MRFKRRSFRRSRGRVRSGRRFSRSRRSVRRVRRAPGRLRVGYRM